MEGNECYKFSTVQNFVTRTSAKPIRVAVDIGCNLGMMTRLMRGYFWHAQVFAFEPVPEYFLAAWNLLRDDPMVCVFQGAVTANHVYEDNLGRRPRPVRLKMQVHRALPSAGMGWRGGSTVLPTDSPPLEAAKYKILDTVVPTLTMDEVIHAICLLSGADEVDYIKMDCEGCENSALGCASPDTLRKIRFIAGEYHDIDCFYEVMRERLYETHCVNLIGDKWGSFFAERKCSGPTILEPSREGMLRHRPELCDVPIDWHVFRPEFVLPQDRPFHGLTN